MKKITVLLGVLSLAFISSTALANNNNMCDYQMDYDLIIKNAALSFVKESGNAIIIDQDNRLLMNGNEISLTKVQQELIDDYADGVRDLIPEVAAIAVEGVNLGVEAATMALARFCRIQLFR